VVSLPLAVLLLCRAVPEPPRRVRSQRVRFADLYRALLETPPLRYFLVTQVLFGLATGAVASLFVIYASHYLGLADKVPHIALPMTLAMALGMPLWLRVMQRVEKHRAWTFAAVGMIAALSVVPALEPGADALRPMIAVMACFGFFLIFAAALGGVQSFAPVAAAKVHGITTEQVAWCLSAYMLCSALGSVLGGQLITDPRRTAWVAGSGFGLAALVALVIAVGQWPPMWVPVLCGLMGFVSGTAGPSRDLLVKQATPPGATGRVYGVVYSGLDAGLVLAAPIFGLLMDAGHYRAVWLGVALLFAVLIVTVLNVRRSSARPPAQAVAA
jgi:fucose permease